MARLFTATILVSSVLLFAVQPMFAKMALPKLGGAPAVWNTCNVFFQLLLLAGYAYAHWGPKLLGPIGQPLAHITLAVSGFLTLPIVLGASAAPVQDSHPVFWLLGTLFVSVGLPFFVVSTTNPLLQRWLSASQTVDSKDPYYLYAASNFGSLLSLVAYPLLIEPNISLRTQSYIWSIGYAGLAVLLTLCAMFALHSRLSQNNAESPEMETPQATAPLPVLRRLRWIALAFVPSSLMLGVTTHLTTDVASAPLFWVAPLALYLVTFIFAFAKNQWISRAALGKMAVYLVIITMLTMAGVPRPTLLVPMILLHLATFFVLGWICHAELAADRPPVEYLTEFYLWMSVGGALGGIFNALVAPVLFREVWEYPLGITLALLFRQAAVAKPSPFRVRRAIGDLLIPFTFVIYALLVFNVFAQISDPSSFRSSAAFKICLLGVPGLVCFALSDYPFRFALGAAGLFAMNGVNDYYGQKPVFHERSFFGVHRISDDLENQRRILKHGVTLHGAQSKEPALEMEPTFYYSRLGPLGKTLIFASERKPNLHVGVIGLGAGGIFAHSQVGQKYSFFEIDPSVVKIAQDPKLFTFLSKGLGSHRVILGDGRLTLSAEPDQSFDVLVIDAFSSNAIPAHLLTRQAIELYRKKLLPDGILVMNISNRYLDLAPLIGGLAELTNLNAYLLRDFTESPEGKRIGKAVSVWTVLAAKDVDLKKLLDSAPEKARDLQEVTPKQYWDDDFTNILGAFRKDWWKPGLAL